MTALRRREFTRTVAVSDFEPGLAVLALDSLLGHTEHGPDLGPGPIGTACRIDSFRELPIEIVAL